MPLLRNVAFRNPKIHILPDQTANLDLCVRVRACVRACVRVHACMRARARACVRACVHVSWAATVSVRTVLAVVLLQLTGP